MQNKNAQNGGGTQTTLSGTHQFRAKTKRT